MGASFSNLKPGDEVIIAIKDIDVVRQMQQNHGGWNSAMHECMEKPCRLIQGIGPDAVVRAHSGKVYRLNSDLLTKYTKSDTKPSEIVQIISDEELMKKLQRGHGDWNDGMRSMLGQKVELVQRFEDGDCIVKYNDKNWTINPQSIASGGDSTNTPISAEMKVGDTVQMIGDIDEIKRLQVNHGGWSEIMSLIVGEKVQIVKIFDDGDFFVSKLGMEWLINPKCIDTSSTDISAQKGADLKKGDFVQISSDVKLSEQKQQGHGGWLSAMALLAGKCGRVEDILYTGDVKVNINGMSFVYNPTLLTKTDAAMCSAMKYSKGDRVRVIKDIEKVKRLQKGHGEWNDSMELLLGKTGKVKSIYFDGDLRVELLGNTVTLNPDCVEMVTSDDDSDEDVPDLMKMLQKMTKILLSDSDKPGKELVIPDDDDDDELVTLTDQDKIFLIALKNGDLADVLDFIDSVDVNKQIKTISPLMVATIEGHLPIVELLLEKQADVNAKTFKGDSALHMAVNGNFPDVCVALVNHGADINLQNQDGLSPLMLAAHSGNIDILQSFLNRDDADLNLGDKDGDTPLHLAIQKSRVESVEKLLNAGADILAVNDKQFTAYHLAALRGNERILEIFLKKEGPSIVNIQKDDKFTALHLTAINNHTECMKLLIRYKADLNIRNTKSQTALHVAVSQRYLECVKILVENKAQLDVKDEDGDTPLHDGVRLHNRERIKKMSSLAGLGDVFQLLEIFNKGSDKPEDIVMYLAENGARLDIENNSGKTPLTFCEDKTFAAKLRTIHNQSKPKLSKEISTDSTLLSSPIPVEKTRDEEIEEMRRIIRKMEEEKTCVICLDRWANVTFGCGHVACVECANNIFECHMCRTTIDRKIRIFN